MVTLPDRWFYGLLASLALLALIAYGLFRLWRRARRELKRADARKRSQSTRYGQLTEQFAPWMDQWPFDPQRFRFLGSPIDGVQFADDAVYLVEIKAASSRLSAEQRRVRQLVEEGRVGWLEVRIDEEGAPELREPWRP